ncbi:HAMP domain-containing sensor histidine kinase [Uliginosibacterium sp. H3]|uniref:histidine kinase n=1 Tax=Uliginosibacterium silvisoli TaxID=3114758 RepID=A0ABU6K275_9RHOO|nr:HAMP domain-containing sensor histidine kinase [Uliginosibacterium sp. H3]
MTERSGGLARLRAGSISLLAAGLSAVGLLVSVPALTTLSLIWFAILLACLAYGLFRLRPVANKGEQGPVATVIAAVALPAQDDATAFLSTVGHDLRQPLQAISLYAATLATHDLPETSKQLVGGLEAAAETLSLQFEEVMAIAKLESGRLPLDPKSVALGAILSSTVAMRLEEAHDKALHLRHVATSLRVWADEVVLARAVDRLVMHAVQITERGGVLVGCRRRGDAVLVEVRDTSGGIAAEFQDNVFKPFSAYGHRLPDRALGLALAERSVQRLGGSLSLRVVAGRGNVFTIRLPRLTGAA